jgi:Ca-activated chloride channel homolog
VPTSSDIFWFLLLLVAILWPFDVALRRLTMSRAQAVAAARALAALRRPPDIELEAPPELARLRSRVAPYRRRVSAAPPPPVIASADARRASAGGDAPDEEEAEALSARLLEARRKRRGSGD